MTGGVSLLIKKFINASIQQTVLGESIVFLVPGDVLPERPVHLAQVLLYIYGTLVIFRLSTQAVKIYQPRNPRKKDSCKFT